MPARGQRAVSDRIEIRDLRVMGVHGVLPEERERAQPFSLDIVAWVDMAAAQRSDELADTVDYGALARRGRRGRRRSFRAARGAGRAAGRRAAGQRPPARGGGGDGAQAAPAAGARRGVDRGQGAARPADGPRRPAGLHRAGLQPRGPAGLPARRPWRGWPPAATSSPSRRSTRPSRWAAPAGQGPYLNVVVELATADPPRRLLERCRAWRRRPHRVRTVRWGPRTLDADVLLVGGLAGGRGGPDVPHPRMWERRFVLQPLADLAPDLVTPDQLGARLVARSPVWVDCRSTFSHRL